MADCLTGWRAWPDWGHGRIGLPVLTVALVLSISAVVFTGTLMRE